MIRRSLDTIEKFTGKRPVGWLGPGLTQTLDTPENLAAAGVKYIGDWVYDDEPTEIQTANGPLVTLPYSVETNDIPMMLVQHHEAAYWTQKCLDYLRSLLRGRHGSAPKIMAIAIHPYISGQPFRIKYLEEVYKKINQKKGVLHWNGEQILDWYLKARRYIYLSAHRMTWVRVGRPRQCRASGAALGQLLSQMPGRLRGASAPSSFLLRACAPMRKRQR